MVAINQKSIQTFTRIRTPDYDNQKIKPGIVHIGVGNFHRAHQAYYTNLCLNIRHSRQWGIIGLGITDSGASMAEKMKAQNHLYTLTEFASNGERRISVIGSIIDYIAGKEEPEKAIAALCNPDIKIVSLTITEGGYFINKNNDFTLSHPDIQHDLQHPQQPATAFGYIAEALNRRKEQHLPGFTILSCDNLQHNGNVTRNAVLTFARARDPQLADWINEHVSFPNSMVDRITPAVKEADVRKLVKENGVKDRIPVYTEKFTQWIIEDKFITGRPEWEVAGVHFVADVTPYENLKLRFLNASHSMLAYPASLMGYQYVDEALNDPSIYQYLRDFMDKDVSPIVEVPEDISIARYKDNLMRRFTNAAISDQLSRLCYHGGAKIPVFILPTLADLLKAHKPTLRIAFLIAAYGHYLCAQKDDMGRPLAVDAPKLTKEDWQKVNSEHLTDFLDISVFAPHRLNTYADFVAEYESFRLKMKKEKVKDVLKQLN